MTQSDRFLENAENCATLAEQAVSNPPVPAVQENGGGLAGSSRRTGLARWGDPTRP
jgi:hypothetical protein